jgi:uncharacterized membrane protein YbhN (UPF0104 family)
MSSARGRNAGTALRALVSLGLLALASTWVDWHEAWRTVAQVDATFLAVPAVLGLAGILLGTLKWSILLATSGHSAPYSRLLGLYWMGMFFNNLLPGRTGGDLIRAYGLTRGNCDSVTAIFSVAADRGLNLIALGVLAIIGVVLRYQDLPNLAVDAPYSSAILLSVPFFALVVWLLRKNAPTPLRRWLADILLAVGTHVRQLLRQPWPLTAACVLAILYQSAMIMNHYYIGLALGLPFGSGTYFCLIPITAVVSLVPVTLNGLGLREGAFAILFSSLGIPPATSVMLSLLAVGITALISLVGGIWYVASGLRPHSDQDTTTIPVGTGPLNARRAL